MSEYWNVYVPEECCPGKWKLFDRFHYFGSVQSVVNSGVDNKGVVHRATLVEHVKIDYVERCTDWTVSNG